MPRLFTGSAILFRGSFSLKKNNGYVVCKRNIHGSTVGKCVVVRGGRSYVAVPSPPLSAGFWTCILRLERFFSTSVICFMTFPFSSWLLLREKSQMKSSSFVLFSTVCYTLQFGWNSRKSRMTCQWAIYSITQFKGTVQWDFRLQIFFMNQFPQTPEYPKIGPFQKFSTICGDVRSSRYITGVVDTVLLTHGKNHKSFLYFVWTPMGRRVNIKINFLYKFNLRCKQSNIVPIFCHRAVANLPPVSLIPPAVQYR